MKKKQTYEIEPMDNLKYVFCIGALSFVMCLFAGCKTLTKNIDSNYKAKNEQAAKKRAQ